MVQNYCSALEFTKETLTVYFFDRYFSFSCIVWSVNYTKAQYFMRNNSFTFGFFFGYLYF